MRPDKATILYVVALFPCGLTTRAYAGASEADMIAGQRPELGMVHENHAMLSAATGPGSYQPLSGKERWNLYRRDAFWSPGVCFRAAGPALGAHLNNEPPAWGQGAEGYGKRSASADSP